MSERELLLQIADDELVLGWRNSEWTGIAPLLEEDVAFSSIAQNEIGHARAIYQLLAGDADALAFDRAPEEYRCAPLVELRIQAAPGIVEDDAFALAMREPTVTAQIDGKQVRKRIFVPDKLLNIVAA